MMITEDQEEPSYPAYSSATNPLERRLGKNFYRKYLGCPRFFPIKTVPFTLPDPHRRQLEFLSSYTL